MAVNKYYYFIILISLLSGIFFILFLLNISLKRRIFASKGTPAIGGIGLGLSFFASALLGMYLFGISDKKIIGILISSFLMFVFGIIDDRSELSVKSKIIAQSAAICVLVSYGIHTRIVYIGALLNIVVTFVWIIGITNAVNHLDIIDGLAGLVVFIATAAFFAISFAKGDLNIIILTLALSGSLVSFLIFNIPPAKIFMGNSGSHFLGFILAVMAIAISYASLKQPIALLSPLLILGLPILDTLFLIVTRVRQRKSPFKKSDDHLVFRFLKLGYSKNKALVVMLLLALLFSSSGVILSRVSNSIGIVLVSAVILASVAFTYKAGRLRQAGTRVNE